MRLSLKLGLLCAAAALAPLFVASIVVVLQVSSTARAAAVEDLRAGARAASALYDKRLVELRYAAEQLADVLATRALVSNDPANRSNDAAALARLQDLLPRAQNDYSLDFIIVTDPQGRVIARHNDRPAAGESVLTGEEKSTLVETVINGGAPVAGCVVERGERYRLLWLDRIARVELADGTSIDEALVLEAAAGIFGGGRLVGTVLIGQMLNSLWKPRPGASSLQTPLVAEVRQTLLRSPDDDTGALVALGRGIIASSIPPQIAGRDGSADPVLLGAVRDPSRQEESVMLPDRGYSVAWEPLKTPDGINVAAIGVARPLREITGAAETVRTTMLLIGSIATVLAGAAGFFFGRLLGVRVDDLRQAASRWTVGELSSPATDNQSLESNGWGGFFKRDEIAILAGQMEQMRMSIRNALERLRRR